MLFRALKSKTGKRAPRAIHGAVAYLPMKTGDAHVADGFAAPLKSQLQATGLGDLVGVDQSPGRFDEPAGIELHLTLASAHPRTLESVAKLLVDLDAPVGSSIEFTETGRKHVFGRTEGLAVDLDPQSNWLDYAEAAIETLAGDATYHGNRTVGGRRRLYFYGENASTMASQLRAAAQLDPRLPDGETIRIG